MKSWVYSPCKTFQNSYLERLASIPHEKDIFQWIARMALGCCIRLWMRVYFRLTISGKEHLPQKESYLLVANHVSHLDIFCLTAALGLNALKNVHIAAAKDVFFTSKRRSILCSLLLNTFAFDRKRGGLKGLKQCKRVLQEPGQVLILFPEGRRSRTGRMEPFKRGIEYLVQSTGVKVVPAGIQGGFKAWPYQKRIPRPYKIHMNLGKPLDGGEGFQLKTLEQEVRKCLEE